jgi:BASS family bile acid:Na+ symporter
MFETQFFSTYLLNIAIALIMFGMGLSLTIHDFRNIFLHPRALIIGLIAQMIWLPVLSIIIALLFPVPNELKVGLILVAICPGGATSNLLNFLLKGNLALCVSLTSINSFLTQFSIPVFFNFALLFFMQSSSNYQPDFWAMVFHILLITAIPVVLGIICRHFFQNWARQSKEVFKYAMPVLLAIALLGAIFLDKKEEIHGVTTTDYLLVIPMTLLLNLGGLLGGAKIAQMMGLNKKDQMTIAIEVGLQNTTLAIAIALGFMHNPLMATPAIVYAFFTFFTTALYGIWISGIKISPSDILNGIKNNKTQD